MSIGPDQASDRAPKASLLYEVQDLTNSKGTGIATYARNLVAAGARLGFSPHALISVERTLPVDEEDLNEILAFDHRARGERRTYVQQIARYFRETLGAPNGIPLFELKRRGLVIDPAAHALEAFDRVLAGTRLFRAGARHLQLYRQLLRVRPTQTPRLFHTTHPVPITVPGCPNIYTVHDIIPLRLPFSTSEDPKRYWELIKTIVQRADHITTVSEHSRRDLIQYLGADEARVTNTYQPVDLTAETAGLDEEEVQNILLHAYALEPQEYFLFCGAIEPKKNLARVLQAYSESGIRRPLVLAGSDGWLNERELRLIGDRRFSEIRFTEAGVRRHRRVRRVRYVPRRHLMALIKGARALVFPSLYEGFGLPVLEALALGTPVITSNTTSLPEVAGEAAVLVDPYSPESIRRALQKMDADADLRRELGQRGPKQAQKFSPQAYDDRVRKLYEKF